MADDPTAARSARQFPSLVPVAVLIVACLGLVGIAAARGEAAWLPVGFALAAAFGAYSLGVLAERRRRRRADLEPRA
jgi:hypothetical protein